MQTNTRAKVSSDQINQAIEQLNSEGTKPTIRAVRERLGAGSPNRIQPLLAAWHDKKKPAEAAQATLSDSAHQTLADLLARERSAAVAAKLNEITELKDQLAEITQAGQQLEDENERLELLNIKLDEQHSQAVTLANERQQRIEQLESEQGQLQKQVQELTQQLAAAQAQLAMQKQQYNDQQQSIEQQTTALEAMRQQLNDSQKASAVAEAKRESAAEAAAATAKQLSKIEQQNEAANEKIEVMQQRIDNIQQQRTADAQQHIQQLMNEQQKNKELIEKLKAAEAKPKPTAKPAAKAKKPVQRPPASKLRRHLTNNEIILLTEDLETLKAKPEAERSTTDNSEIKKLEKQLALSPPPPSQS